MIFDESFDRTLWLMIASSEEDREKIGKFISLIPEEIYSEIQEVISDYRMYGSNGEIFRKSYSNIDGYDYYIRTKIFSGRLIFNVTRWKESSVRVEEDYELKLMSISREDLKDMMFDKRKIGSYLQEVNNITFSSRDSVVDNDTYNRNYRIFRIPFGCIMDTYLKHRTFSSRVVNIYDNIPDELFVLDFSSKEKRKGIVKRRIRENRK